ncbi:MULTISPECIES: murein hydrolase activator EnvC family protein [Peribacillus]|uniref:murein hydrolase activator EnvC family protein n=1 Tax=Peribacillus TaxID=2675229 RepID=UPI000709CB13|nr:MULTISPECIES: M23 family metallopeptidase [Peribacillus]KRF50778.1 peptidase M23 [Bacillus sp. Soil745]MBD8138356.1 peptidoglycan DD-metalloendopeptidase family protein [Bacillus sp. CFBP 13597]MDP9738469.1 peptidoglycan hydrolase CwlO-like protein [Bacillus sp. B2I3]PAW29477.1 peptidase M23 [Peribacillus simplex]PEF35596.1 peptidase M23 [Bacillus sp. AFS094228]PEO48443.1 peptidase M23 [Bacillus sp. AFS026049]PHD76548.1 peptidase M23 [Bacillus sp. AFS043905]QNK49438.1 peptidoglycan DD-me
MKKNIIAMNASIMIGLGSILAAPSVYAESISDLEKQKESIQEKRSGVESNISDTEKKIDSLQDKQMTAEDQIAAIEAKIAESAKKIDAKNAEITQTKKEIEALKEEIKVLKERIAKRNEVLKERALSFQETGGDVNYLEVLFGSSSFGDLVDRVGAVATIAEADRDILKQHELDKKDLEEKQKAVETKLASLEVAKAELLEIQKQQKQQKQEKDALVKKLKQQTEKHEHEKMGLEEEKANLAAQEKAIKSAISLEHQRLAELEAARKKAAAEAKKRAEQEAAQAAAQAASQASQATETKKQSTSSGYSAKSNSSSSSSPASSNVSQAPAVSSGTFTRPSAGYVSSTMGERWNKQHAGIDIAASGTVPVVAAADGVVSRSYFSSTYGNVVFVTHSISGQQWTTVYAHLSSRQVGEGAVVAKGQQVGIMGNTGHSFGQHLHFELHKGPWNYSKSNAVNPLNYVNI